MKKGKFFISMLLPVVLLTVFLTACPRQPEEPPAEQEESHEPAEKIEQDANELGGKIESSLLRAKQEYETMLEARLNEFDNKVNELKDKAKSSAGTVQSEMNQAIAELEEKREEVRKKYEELKSASADSWESLKDGVDAAVDALGRSYDEALSHFK
ncbi:MAG: hypothetical protein AB1847_12905 [bacterium]